MKRPRPRGRWPWLLGLLLVPAMAWAVVLAWVPTDWARARLVEKLERQTGRSVRIGSLRLCPLGNLRIVDLSIAEPRTKDDPWLRVAEARLDIHLGQVLLGHCDPGTVEVDGLAIRIWCRKDGTPEFGDILRPAGSATPGSARAEKAAVAGFTLKIRDANVRVVDEPSGTRVDLTDVEARLKIGWPSSELDELKGTLNGGTIRLAARLDRDLAASRIEAEVEGNGIGVDRGLSALGIFLPVAAGVTEGVGGKLTLKVGVAGQGATRDEIRRSLKGHGSIVLNPVDLAGSRFLDQLEVLGDWPSDSRVGSVTSDFLIDRGRFSTDDLTIRVSQFPFVLAGWTDFDGRFDFAAKVEAIAAKLPREARGLIGGNLDGLSGLRFQGDPRRMSVTVNGRPLAGDPSQGDAERSRFRESARRIRDRFFR